MKALPPESIWTLRRAIREIIGARPTADQCQAVAAELRKLAAELEDANAPHAWAAQWQRSEDV
jgi:hypothetical protein